MWMTLLVIILSTDSRGLASAPFPALPAGCGNFTCQTKLSLSDAHFVPSPGFSTTPIVPSFSLLFLLHFAICLLWFIREKVVLLEGQVRSHCIICRLCTDWMQAWKSRLNSLSKAKMWRKRERGGCLMHYLSRPFRGEGTPLSFKRLKINQQTENLSRHGALWGSATHVFPSIYYKENFHGKSMYFLYILQSLF